MVHQAPRTILGMDVADLVVTLVGSVVASVLALIASKESDTTTTESHH